MPSYCQHTICALAIVLAIGISGAHGAPRISGFVSDESGAPISGAEVTFYNNTDTFRTLTDNTGWYDMTHPITTGVGDGRPTGFVLHQNYPNPFNPTTTIEYDLSRRAHVTLDIYSVTGQRVRRLVSGSENTGRHIVQWDGRDDQSRKLGAGLYFYRLTADGFAATQKMLLLDGGGVAAANANSPLNLVDKPVMVRSNEYNVSVHNAWYVTLHTSVEIQNVENEMSRDFVLSPVVFFPMHVGDKWRHLKLNVETQTFLYELDLITIPDSVSVDGRKYFHVTQDWNSHIPDTLTVRQDGFLMYWHLGGKDCLVCDFKAPVDSSWTVSLPAFENNEAQTLMIQKVQLDDSPIHQYQYLKYSLPGKNIYWYEQYYVNKGIFIIHGVNVNPGTTETYVLSYLKVNNHGSHYDYDNIGLWRMK